MDNLTKEENRKMAEVIKNFTVTPYEEVQKTLDKVAADTVRLVLVEKSKIIIQK